MEFDFVVISSHGCGGPLDLTGAVEISASSPAEAAKKATNWVKDVKVEQYGPSLRSWWVFSEDNEIAVHVVVL